MLMLGVAFDGQTERRVTQEVGVTSKCFWGKYNEGVTSNLYAFGFGYMKWLG